MTEHQQHLCSPPPTAGRGSPRHVRAELEIAPFGMAFAIVHVGTIWRGRHLPKLLPHRFRRRLTAQEAMRAIDPALHPIVTLVVDAKFTVEPAEPVTP